MIDMVPKLAPVLSAIWNNLAGYPTLAFCRKMSDNFIFKNFTLKHHKDFLNCLDQFIDSRDL